jgi:hypothetical protein
MSVPVLCAPLNMSGCGFLAAVLSCVALGV